jgi:hypothetical protein
MNARLRKNCRKKNPFFRLAMQWRSDVVDTQTPNFNIKAHQKKKTLAQDGDLPEGSLQPVHPQIKHQN